MLKSKIICALSAAILLAVSICNLLFRDSLYPSDAYADMFYTNDLVNAIICGAFLLIIILLKKNFGAFIGLHSSLIYMAVPLLLAQGFAPITLMPLATLLVSAFGIIDQVKIEEVLVNEKGVMRAEHIVYSAIAALLCVMFIVRAVGMLAKPEAALSQGQITSIADLTLVAVWIVLAVISVVNADKRRISLGGIMICGTILTFGLIVFLLADAALGRNPVDLPGLGAVAVMSLLFAVPAWRLSSGGK